MTKNMVACLIIISLCATGALADDKPAATKQLQGFAYSLAAAGAEAKLDSVLGVPWGSSFEQARQIIAGSSFSFSKEYTDMGSLVRSFKGGTYAGYTAYIHMYFIDDQMYQLNVTLWEDDIGYLLQDTFADLDKLLTQKYGPKSSDISAYGEQPLWTGSIWSLDGNAKKITLQMTTTRYFNGENGSKVKWDGKVVVSYENLGLRNALKSKSRQNI